MVIRRGDVFYADLRPVVGSEQGGIRPVLIIQNDIGNRHSPTVICAAITKSDVAMSFCEPRSCPNMCLPKTAWPPTCNSPLFTRGPFKHINNNFCNIFPFWQSYK